MERGIPNITVYSFEAAPGRELRYPIGELWTLDLDEAHGCAKAEGCQLIGTDYKSDDDSEMIEDYTPRTHFQFIGADDGDITGDADQEDEAYRVHASDEDVPAASVARDEHGQWYPVSGKDGHLVADATSLINYPTWRDAMKAFDVTDFRELDG